MGKIKLININEGEKIFCEWQLGQTGGFFKHLIEAIIRADSTNMEKLSKSFPDLVAAVNCYQNVEGYWEDLKRRYEQEYNSEYVW